MTITIQIEIDDSILLSLKEDKPAFAKEMRFHNALYLYRKHRLSLGKAAQLAGYDRLDFIQKLKLEGEPIFDYDEDMLKEMIEDSNKILPLIKGDVK